MPRKYLLEISVDSIARALAAERGGAGRIELCADLSVGGLTPSRELLRSVRKKVRIPIFSMIRPRAGDFVYSDAEFSEMERSIAVAAECGMNGVVLGILRKDHRVDVEQTKALVSLAQPLPVTFHRAFDECPDLLAALEAVIHTGAARILTSGGAKTALQGAAKLAELVAAARNRVSGVGTPVDPRHWDSRGVAPGLGSLSARGAQEPDRILIVPGAGITHSNLAEVAQQTGAIEFHSGLSSVLPYSSRDFTAFESEVRKLADQLAHLE